MLSDKQGPVRPGEEQFPRVHSNRTLSDIIRDESGGTAHYYTGKKSWRHFKDKLRRRRGAAWTSSFSTPTSDIPINNRSMNRRPSGGFPSDSAHLTDISAVPNVDPDLMSYPRNKPSLQRNASRAMERASGRSQHMRPPGKRTLLREDNGCEDEDDDDEEEEEEGDCEEGESGCDTEEEEASGEAQQPVRMSLMSLLAETDREMGLDGSSYMLDEDDEDEDEDEDGDGECNNCCVCMVRHKGAAFVPCGHSFCRLCSRELWAQRGNCPLCNNYILEILDIF